MSLKILSIIVYDKSSLADVNGNLKLSNTFEWWSFFNSWLCPTSKSTFSTTRTKYL